MRIDAASFDRMVEGRLNPTVAMLQGLIHVDGAIDLLWYFQKLFPPAPADAEAGTMRSEQVSILDGNTFVVSDHAGDIEASPTDTSGLFAWDTRFLSRWVLTVDGERLASLSTDELQYFQSRFFLVAGTGTVYVDSTLSAIRVRTVGGGFHEQLTLLNHGEQPVDVTVRLDAGSDFADLFEVKDALAKKGSYSTAIEAERLVLRYQRERFHRETTISADRPAEVDEQGLNFRAAIEPKGEWSLQLDVVIGAVMGGVRVTPAAAGGAAPRRRNLSRDLESWVADAPTLECDWDPLKRTYTRSLVDLAALRFSPPSAGGRSLPAAGLPWFMTMFGRDSIFTSLQALPFAPELAATTLRELASRQGSRSDDFRDEDPGRIPHELRYGELTAFEERPHSPYFGNADATPLFVVLLDEYERWSGDTALVRRLEPEARAALAWIDDYADLLGNGYVWYRRRNEQTGLENQCWKDSWDSISYHDGRLPGFPRATCELQGYAYDARTRGARLARLVWKDARLRGSARAQGGRSQAPLQPRLLARRRRVLRALARPRRQRRRRAVLEHRPPLVERHRGSVEGQGRGRPADGATSVLGLGRAHASRGRGPLQSDRIPRRHRLAVRQLVHRLGAPPLRLPRGGCPDRGRHPGCGRVLRRTAAGGVRRLPPPADALPGRVPHRLQPAGMVDRRPIALVANDAGAGAAGRPAGGRPGAAARHRTDRATGRTRPLGTRRRLRPRPLARAAGERTAGRSRRTIARE